MTGGEDERDENGYRYYEAGQMADLHRIISLKNMGFSIDDIRRIINGAEEKNLLLGKKQEIQKEIAALTARLAEVESYLEENGYEICGNIRESYIDGVWNKETEGECLTEIQVPVQKIKH